MTGRSLPEHLVEACEHADRNPYALELLPRGGAKTTGLSVYRSAWKIGRDPSYRLVLVSRGERLVRRISRRIKRVMREPRYVALFGRIAPVAGTTKDTESEWERVGSTAAEPTFVGLGAGGPVPGTRADEVVVDDPLKLQDVRTRAQRDKLFDWFLTELLPVASDADSRVLVLGTRYHEDDLFGRLIRQSEGEELELDDDAGFDPDEDADRELWALYKRSAIEVVDGVERSYWPAVWSIERLQRRRKRLGEAIFSLQYGNDPSGMGGFVFKREHFTYVTQVSLDELRSINVGLDLASSEKQLADETAAVAVGEYPDGRLVVLDWWAARLSHGHREWLLGVESEPDGRGGTRLRVVDGQFVDVPPISGSPGLLRSTSPYRGRISALNIEAVQWQGTFARELLASTRLPVRAITSKQTGGADKVTRARPLSTRYEQGLVVHLEKLRGDRFEDQLVHFPFAEHDDLPDAEVYAADVGYGAQVFA